MHMGKLDGKPLWKAVERVYCAYPFKKGQWYHIAGVFDISGGDNAMKLYLNGKEVISKRATNSWGFERICYIGTGGHHGEADSYFSGIIDEVRIYKRALTVGEIKRHSEGRYGDMSALLKTHKYHSLKGTICIP